MNRHTKRLKRLNPKYTHAEIAESNISKAAVNSICSKKKNAVTAILLVSILKSFFIKLYYNTRSVKYQIFFSNCCIFVVDLI